MLSKIAMLIFYQTKNVLAMLESFYFNLKGVRFDLEGVQVYFQSVKRTQKSFLFCLKSGCFDMKIVYLNLL